jgi:chromosome segregation ATPase
MQDKDAYRRKLEARLAQWRAEIDKLEAKAREAGADARIRYETQIEEWRGKEQDARRRLEDLDRASGEAWKDLKAGLEKAWDDLGRAAKTAAERFG